jgi:hypothetical protein
MDETQRARRRARHRERRLIKRMQLLGPLLIVALACLLSAGVVKVMEVRPEPQPERGPEPPAAIAQNPGAADAALLSIDILPTLPETLAVSILDHEVLGAPEDNRSDEAPFEREFEEADEFGLLLPGVDAQPPRRLIGAE